MSGILNNKSRILDTIVTNEGKRQIASSKLKIMYVSFTDASTFYDKDSNGVIIDATKRLYFENCNLPQDQITFEADDSGAITGFVSDQDIQLSNGKIITYELSGSIQNMTILNGQEFASTAGTLLKSSFDHFKRLQIIGTRDKLFEDDGFAISNKSINFDITDDRPIENKARWTANVNVQEPLYRDNKLLNSINFHYLPPVYKTTDNSIDKTNYKNTNDIQIGNYPPWGSTQIDGLTPADVEEGLSFFEQRGYSKRVFFDPTTGLNNLIGQMFEISNDTVIKLDVINYGQYTWRAALKNVFFVGKIIKNDLNVNTFIHMFTLVFG